MKTAIIINGHVRTWERCKGSFLDTFEYLNADVFVSTYKKQFEYSDYLKGLQNFYEEKTLDEDDIREMFSGLNLKKIVIDDTEKMIPIYEEESKNINLHFNTEKHGPKIFMSVYPQYRKLYYIMKDIEEYEKEHNFEYDRIIKTRTEVMYKSDVFKESFDTLTDKEILIDEGSVPLNDVMFACSKKNMIKITKYMHEEFFDPKFPLQDIFWPPHSMLRTCVEVNNMQIVAKNLFKHIEREKINQVY